MGSVPSVRSEGSGGSAAGSVTETRTRTRTENAEGPVPANVVGVPVLERGREKDPLEQWRIVLVVPGVESERRNVAQQGEKTAGVGRGVESGREGAGAEIVRGRGAKVWKGRRSVKQTGLRRVGSGCWRNMRAKWVRAWKSVKKRKETAGAATETETDAGETVTKTGSTRGSGGRETGGSAERSAKAPYEMMRYPKMTWAMRMRGERLHTWMSTVRTG